ncbi:hypothetical protein [Haladaptatus sp. GCM10025893]|uniref:hypothetical protein n=1 Tax=Haladaptatus sp. GCM10025893 TaxID=3252659 RepID=UPI00360B2D54
MDRRHFLAAAAGASTLPSLAVSGRPNWIGNGYPTKTWVVSCSTRAGREPQRSP